MGFIIWFRRFSQCYSFEKRILREGSRKTEKNDAGKGKKKESGKKNYPCIFAGRGGILLWVVFFIGIFWLLCFLEDIPQDVTIYTLQLASFTGIAVLIVRFIRYWKRCKTLELLTKDPRDKIEAFPNPDTLSEKLYRQIIGQYERELRKEEQQMDDRYREMVEYYTMWTHQIKTPIAAMHLLLQEEETPVSKELQGELFQVEQYVQMALQYLRMERMNTDLVFEKQELDALIHQAVRKYAPLFIRRKIALQYEDVHCQILTDEKWLEFVLEQVLSNALKYTRKGKIKIYMDPQSPKTLVIEDTGIGIAPEDLPRVFERGYTGYNGRTDKRSTGIGLYLCRQIMDRLSHTIRIESEMGVGTRVYLGLDTVEL